MRGLFRWSLEAEHIKIDPTAGVKNPPRNKNAEGFKIWEEEELEAYYAKWPIGTRQRVWIDILAYTGLRRGDAVRLGRQHIRDGVATIKTEKSSFTTEVSIPTCRQRLNQARRQTLHSTAVLMESRTPRNRSATSSSPHAGKPVSIKTRKPHTACGRSRRPVWPKPVALNTN